jgi:acyltransferase
MNGFFYHFVNKPLAAWCAESFPGNGPAVFLIGMAVTVACIGACVPVILALNRAMPQLVGKPRQTGLFFGPLLRG